MPNNDLISRAAAIAEVEQWAEHGYDVIHWTGIKAMLETQPAVDAAPVVHANWTSHRTVEHDGEWYCSACGYEPTVFEGMPFCAKCGARMDGGEDDADGETPLST